MALDVTPKHCDRLIALGICSAITEARQVCTVLHELAKEVPKSFGQYRLLQPEYTAKGVCKQVLIVHPKPAREQPWLQDSGW
eukprot:1827384-Rhodomonas_salina.2